MFGLFDRNGHGKRVKIALSELPQKKTYIPSRKKNRRRVQRYTPWGKPALERKKVRTRYDAIRKPDVGYIQPVEKIREVNELMDSDAVTKYVIEGQQIPSHFGETLKYFMDKADRTVDELAALTGLSEKTLRRWCGEAAPRPTPENVMLICIAMHLTYRNSHRLFELGGIILRDVSPVERAYETLLDSASHLSVRECNEMLVKMGFFPLTEKEIVDEKDLTYILYGKN